MLAVCFCLKQFTSVSECRAPQGERVIDKRPVSPGEAVNTVVVLTEQGLYAQWCDQGALIVERFVTSLDVYVLSLLFAGKTWIFDRYPVYRARAVRTFLNRHHMRLSTCRRTHQSSVRARKRGPKSSTS